MSYAPGKILFVGDSITVGGGDENSDGGYPSHTIALLNTRDGTGWAESTTRAAHGGYNIWQAAGIIDADIAAVTANAPPDYIFLYYCANDAFDYGDPTHYPFDATVETVWKAACAYVIEALHTAFPNATMWFGKTYRCNSNGDVEPWLPTYVFPWIDDMAATYDYLNVGIRGDEVLTAGWSESMSDGVHPSCIGHQLLAAAIRDEMFPAASAGHHRIQRMNGGMQALSGGMNG